MLNGQADNQAVLTPDNLKALRKEAKLANEELAKRCMCSHQSLSHAVSLKDRQHL